TLWIINRRDILRYVLYNKINDLNSVARMRLPNLLQKTLPK
ncbi:hypothetical protein HMPREF0083_05807, partial [Aneurinibacillus aneurinilyticus ATCC 12856]